MAADIISWLAVGLILATSTTILISRDWRVSLGSLAAQYISVFWLASSHLPFVMGSVKLIAGWMVVAALGMTRLGLINLEEEEDTFWPRGRWFRVILTFMVLLVTAGSTADRSGDTGLGLPVIQAAAIGAGVVHLGVTSSLLRVTACLQCWQALRSFMPPWKVPFS